MKAITVLILVPALLAASGALGQDMPQGQSLSGDQVIPGGQAVRAKRLPGDTVIPSFPIQDPALRARVEEAAKVAQGLREQLPAEPATQPPALPAVVLPEEPTAPEPTLTLPAKPKAVRNRRLAAPVKEQEGFRDAAGGVRVFTRNLGGARSAGKDSFTLPSTSIALATLLYGIEATANEEREVPAELNYAWLGPNGTIVEMKNCRLWIKVRGDYSTERLYGKADTISCKAPNGETFDIPIVAHLVDKAEEYLGARGELVARGKALGSALSFLSDGVSAFGTAMASAQVQTDVAPGSPYTAPVKGSSVGGDKTKYIAGQTIAGSTAKFLDWWIDYYMSLSPTIAIGPGKKVYLAVRGTVEIPKIFFGERIEQSQFEQVAKSWNSEASAGSKVNTTNSISRAAPSAPGGMGE
jgi:conjugal transfer pilus assembly protein TraB